MGFSTFSGPLRAGTVKENAGINTGLVVLAQQGVLTFSNTTAKDLFILPAGAFIVDIGITTTVAFNAGTNNVLTIRTKAGSPTNLAVLTATSANIAVGFTAPTLQTGGISTFANVGTSDLTIEGLFAGTGTAATTGSAIITCLYIQRAKDGSFNPASA
jgi:hypothetical protein